MVCGRFYSLRVESPSGYDRPLSMNGAENWDGCTRQNQSGVLHIPFLQCKKLHSLVSQVGSNGYAEALHCTVHRERAIRPVAHLAESERHFMVMSCVISVRKRLFYWALWSIPVFCSDHTQTPHINPAEYSPEEDLGLLTGMVSPFWAPGRSTHRLHAFILLTEPTGDGEQPAPLVAISLSPWESLLVPRAQFRVLVQRYAQRAYPTLRWLG